MPSSALTGNVVARIYKRGYIPGLYFGPIGKAVQAGNMQTGEARVDRKQTASPVAVNEVEVEVNVDDVEAVEANATAPGSRPPAPGFFLDNFIIPFETSAVRIKIIIVALVIGLVWGGGRDSDKRDSKESTSHLFITASEEQ